MLVARLARYAEIIGFILWAVMLFVQLSVDNTRFLYVLVYVLHLMSVGGILHFTQATHQHVGTWFFLVVLVAGVVADTGSFVEQIQDVVDHGASTFAVFKTIMWSWAVALDVAYIVWCCVTYFCSTPTTRRKPTRV